MMIKQLLFTALTLFLQFSAFAQSDSPAAATNWGETVYGLALSTTLSHETIATGTGFTITCLIKNDTTNLVDAPIIPAGFYVVLTNSSGALYELTLNPDKITHQGGSAIPGRIQPGKTNSYYLPLNLGPAIKPGDYELITRRRLLVGGKSCALISTLKIKVVKGSGSYFGELRIPTTDGVEEAPPVKPGVNK